jgi:hypothetical protein
MSSVGRVLIVAHADRNKIIRIISAAKQRSASEHNMKKRNEKQQRRDELRREYDLSKLKGAVRGKYVARFRAGTNLVLLSPDVAEYFPGEQSVNTALRTLIRVAKKPLRHAH